MRRFITAVVMAVFGVLPLLAAPVAQATSLGGETFTGISTPAGSWLSGGNGTVACLTAASGSIPACSGGPLDSVGGGKLRLTPAQNSRAGFAIYNTPVSAGSGLDIQFDMYQYGGTGADGISFFLIDGATSPTAPGAYGGALGYASSSSDPGIVGGYIGVGFDRYGNFTNSNVGADGPGAQANTIAIRGSQGTNYKYVTRSAADGALAGTTRANSQRHVKITISTLNVMSVLVDYGSGYVTELAGINLNTINGTTIPATFKMGFAASTGGSNNTHEISGLSVQTNPPSLTASVAQVGTFVQGSPAQFTLGVANDASAEATTGSVTMTHTLPAGLVPAAASGAGWTCGVAGQVVTCTRPGDGANALDPGEAAPDITVDVDVADNAGTPLSSTVVATTAGNSALAQSTANHSATVQTGSYQDDDGVYNAIEGAAPNGGDGNDDGTADRLQDKVTSLLDPVSGAYAVLESSGCPGANTAVSIAPESGGASADGVYTYPAGLMNFEMDCAAPGDTATVVQYFYGSYNAAQIAARKYNAIAGTYQTIPGSVVSNVTIGGQAALKIVYQITDGGPLDQDGLADGTIIDPAGPAVLSAAVTAPTMPTTPGTPDTGLPAASRFIYYLAGLAGLGLLSYEIISYRRAKTAATITFR